MPKVMLIDDEADLCALFHKVVCEWGYPVQTFQSAKEGVRQIKRFMPDIVFLDIKMPAMDGLEILKKIKRISKDIAVIMLTGYGTLKTAREAMKWGAYDYTTKPFNLDLIHSLIRELGSSQRQSLLSREKSLR